MEPVEEPVPLDDEHYLEPLDAQEPSPAPVVADARGRLWRVRHRSWLAALRDWLRGLGAMT
jgi:hypothetical protein